MGWFGGSYCNRIWLHDTAVQSFLEPTFLLDHNVRAPVCSLVILHYCAKGGQRMEARVVGFHQSCRIRRYRRRADAYGLPIYEYRSRKHALDTNETTSHDCCR